MTRAVSRSTANSPLILALVSQSTNWNPGGLLGSRPEAKLPSSQALFMNLQRSGYLTATTEWYVMGLTLELDGSISPHAWMSLTPAVWELSTAGMSRTKDRGKFTVVLVRPSSRNWANSCNWATSCHPAMLRRLQPRCHHAKECGGSATRRSRFASGPCWHGEGCQWYMIQIEDC